MLPSGQWPDSNARVRIEARWNGQASATSPTAVSAMRLRRKGTYTKKPTSPAT